MKKISWFPAALFILFLISSCNLQNQSSQNNRPQTRPVRDTVGYAHLAWQMDSLLNRLPIALADGGEDAPAPDTAAWRAAVFPHDDYAYAGEVYTYPLKKLRANTVVLFGVAHQARRFNLGNKLVFGSFTHWQAPYGPLPVSALRDELLKQMDSSLFVIHDSMMMIEHSLEALLPFLQSKHSNLEIVPILVPYMSFEKMRQISRVLAKNLNEILNKHHYRWGRDVALAISNDCVHYGDDGWGGKNYAPFGVDKAGYRQAVEHDLTIIRECLSEQIDTVKIRKFTRYTVEESDFRKYRWTWCGRYSLPLGLLTGYYLAELRKEKPLSGVLLKYGTSIEKPALNVSDLGMGVTAPATLRHWVGYAGIGFK